MVQQIEIKKRKGYYGQTNGNERSKTHCGSISFGRKGRDCSTIGWGTTLLVAPKEQMEEATSKQQLVIALAHFVRSGLKPFLGEKPVN